MRSQKPVSMKKSAREAMLSEAILESDGIKEILLGLFKKRKAYIGGTVLVAATFIANVLNYGFNAYLGRVLTFDNFALIGLMGGFYSFASIPFGAYGTTVTFTSSFLIGKYGDGAGYQYWRYMTRNVRFIALGTALLWLMLTPFLMKYFNTNNIYLFLFFAAILLVGFFNNINLGFLAAKMRFGFLAILSLTDPITKLITAIILVALGLHLYTFSAIPMGTLMIALVAWTLIVKFIPKESTTAPQSELHQFSKRFFFISLLTTFTSLAFFTFDIFLAKHYLSPVDAGRYALISLVGKMIFFLGNLTSPFIIPLISRSEGAQKNSSRTLYLLLGCTTFFAFLGYLLFGVFAHFTVPLLYGEKALSILSCLLYFTFGMMCYTISSVFISYYLVRRIYTFTLATSLLIILQIILLSFFHQNVHVITIVMTIVLTSHLFLTTLLHLNARRVQRFEKRYAYFLHSSSEDSNIT